MSFDFASLDTGAPAQPAKYTLRGDPSVYHIMDRLSENAEDWEIWQWLEAELEQKISRYRSKSHMLKFWFSRQQQLQAMADAEPQMFLNIVNHFAAQLDALTECAGPSRPS